MKAEELRIGNLVYDFGGNAVEIVRLTKGKTPLESPIPITEEWLLKFGGIPDESNDIYLPLQHGIDM